MVEMYLESKIYDLSLLLRLVDSPASPDQEAVSERDILLLKLLEQTGAASISTVVKDFPNGSDSTISVALTGLQRRGFIEKFLDAATPKSRFVKLTDHGRRALESIGKRRAGHYQGFLNDIALRENERATLEAVFGRAIDEVTKILRTKHREAERSAEVDFGELIEKGLDNIFGGAPGS